MRDRVRERICRPQVNCAPNRARRRGADRSRQTFVDNLNPGFRIDFHQKDLNLELHGARALLRSLPNAPTCWEPFNACAAHGDAARDHRALVPALRRMADHEIGPRGVLVRVLD